MTTKTHEAGLRVGGQDLSIWPPGQEAQLLCQQPSIMATHFEDGQPFHQRLIDHILELEKDPEFTHYMPTGGSKVKHMHLWDSPEAGLLTERALSFFAQAADKVDAEVELSWASIYRNGSYLSPHGHPQATGSVVYCLDSGDPDYERSLYSGKLVFADPRIGYCCNVEESCVTRTLPADMREGTMVLFPGPIVHFVHPYNGTRPRITLSWNIN